MSCKQKARGLLHFRDSGLWLAREPFACVPLWEKDREGKEPRTRQPSRRRRRLKSAHTPPAFRQTMACKSPMIYSAPGLCNAEGNRTESDKTITCPCVLSGKGSCTVI